MKYVYYDASSGMIKIISPVKEENPTDPCIEVEDSDVDNIMSNRVNLLDYIVEISSKTSGEGSIRKKDRGERVWSSINDWLYLIPTDSSNPEFRIDQYLSEKKIVLSLDETTAEWWEKHKFFQKESVLISACNGVDPHKVVWWKKVPSKDLLEGVDINYTGTDNLRFYTHRYFEEYLHEQHT